MCEGAAEGKQAFARACAALAFRSLPPRAAPAWALPAGLRRAPAWPETQLGAPRTLRMPPARRQLASPAPAPACMVNTWEARPRPRAGVASQCASVHVTTCRWACACPVMAGKQPLPQETPGSCTLHGGKANLGPISLLRAKCGPGVQPHPDLPRQELTRPHNPGGTPNCSKQHRHCPACRSVLLGMPGTPSTCVCTLALMARQKASSGSTTNGFSICTQTKRSRVSAQASSA